MNVKDCTDVNDNPYYGCYLRVGGRRVGYKLAPLAVLGGGNETQEIWFDSVHGMTATKSVCFYNVSVTDGTTSNCSGVVLESGNTVEPPITDPRNSGPPPNNVLQWMYQPLFP